MIQQLAGGETVRVWWLSEREKRGSSLLGDAQWSPYHVQGVAGEPGWDWVVVGVRRNLLVAERRAIQLITMCNSAIGTVIAWYGTPWLVFPCVRSRRQWSISDPSKSCHHEPELATPAYSTVRNKERSRGDTNCTGWRGRTNSDSLTNLMHFYWNSLKFDEW
jgi:hypothetical protein